MKPILLVCLLLLWTISLRAVDTKKPTDHSHRIVNVQGNPTFLKLEMKLERPRRILQTPKGQLILVDSGAGTVIQRDAKGATKVLVKDLSEPSGLTRDRQGNLYVSMHAEGEEKKGSVIQITPDGKTKVLAKDLTGPKGLALDVEGNLYVACFEENQILKIEVRKGTVSTFAKEVPTPAGLVFDKRGNLYAASSVGGTVTKITPKGKVSQFATGLKIPSDLAMSPEGHLLVTNYGGTVLTRVDRKGTAHEHATVPEGTIGLCVDVDGNLYLVNWDYQILFKRTEIIAIPCPHCKKKIRIRLQPEKKRQID